METVRTRAQQKAYERWLASDESSADKKWAQVVNAIVERYQHLPEKERRKAINNAILRALNKHGNPPRAHIVGGGIPSLGKKR